MGYRSLHQCVEDLRRNDRLIEISEPIDAHLEAAEIQRRVYAAGGPALLFSNVKGCGFPMVSNLFGTLEQARFLFRDTLEGVKRAIELKTDPSALMRNPPRYWKAPLTAWAMRPKRTSRGPVAAREISIDQLPQLVSWPKDGGPFITLPQVYSEDANRPGLMNSNLGMYRIQLGGNEYTTNREIGLHYQIHRGIGVHHQAAVRAGQPLRVNVFVGGTPAMTLAAVMPLPEGMSELTFAGALSGHRIPMVCLPNELPYYGEADFVITGQIEMERQLPEGPFGDHLGYYSLQHEFPVLRVDRVLCRENAIWPFTVVGRPPQEDTTFGELIHELTGPAIPTVIAGIKAVNAVDAAGVHPLMLSIGSERYMPYRGIPEPQELLTQANAILGQGQMSLAKYLMIVNEGDDRNLDVNDIESYFTHLLSRIDWRRDLHFQTRTTIDTLDYSGTGFNQGSKVVMAAVGPATRQLPRSIDVPCDLPDRFTDPKVALPGILVVNGPPCEQEGSEHEAIAQFCQSFDEHDSVNRFPMIVIVDDSEFTAATINNFLWVTFTRSNPASDIQGIGASIVDKHWGCRGSLVIDARIKPRHAPPLVEDPQTCKRIDALAAQGGKIGRYL